MTRATAPDRATQTDPPATTGIPAPLPLQLREIPLRELVASTTNPRKHFDDRYIDELALSIAEKGLIQPIVVRLLDTLRAVGMYPEAAAQAPRLYEIVAGECRYRASRRAGATAIAAIVRDYTDEQVLEIQLIENIHRTDLTPLEQAAGYRRLIDTNPTKHSAESIATRIGMSPAWVWDRLKLNDLIPDAAELLEREMISESHAIVIARLKPEQQQRVIHPDKGGLWEDENGRLTFSAEEKAARGRYVGHKPVSLNELRAWITHHIRFEVDHAAKAAPLEFGELAEKVSAAAAQPGRGKKVIPITHDFNSQSEAAKADGERTYGSTAWRRADGTEKSKRCEHAVLGVVVAGGRDYGQAFDVCVARDRCEVHWAKEIREKQKTQKLRDSGQAGKASKREAAWQVKQRRESEERKRKEERWKKFSSALQKSVHEQLAQLKTVTGPLYAQVLKHHHLPPATQPADLPMALLRDAIRMQFDRYSWYSDEPKQVAWAKLLGVDVKAIEKSIAPADNKPAAKRGKKR